VLGVVLFEGVKLLFEGVKLLFEGLKDDGCDSVSCSSLLVVSSKRVDLSILLLFPSLLLTFFTLQSIGQACF